jgi:hypothetical protein
MPIARDGERRELAFHGEVPQVVLDQGQLEGLDHG